MPDILTDLSEPALVLAIEANAIGQFALLRFWPPAVIHRDPEMLWTMTPVHFAPFNQILRAQLSAEDADAAIRRTIARGRDHGVPLMWTTGPSTLPADLGAQLMAHGFRHAGTAPGMALALQAQIERTTPSSALSIITLQDARDEAEWYMTMARAFEMPDFVTEPMCEWLAGMRHAVPDQLRHYLARLDGAGVGVATLFLGDGVAGLYQIGVEARARRQGIGAALTLAALRDARELGYRIAVLHSSPAGYGLYQRLGFREYCRFEHYIWSA